MKKLLIASLLFITTLVSATSLQDLSLNVQEMRALAQELEIPFDADLLAATQKEWLRQPGKERWEVQNLSPEKTAIVLTFAEKQGMFADILPAQKHYDKAILLGTSTRCMARRLNYLIKLWKEGVHFEEVLWLTGDRPLHSDVDHLLDRCTTESQAAQILWEETEMPDELRSLPIFFIATPMQGTTRRPNTEDTIVTYLKLHSTPCTLLFISDQPFCGYQAAVIGGVLPKDFVYDIAGPGVDPSSHPRASAILLDNIARWFYQEKKNQSSK